MLANVSEVKQQYENFHMEGYLMLHRAMAKDINDLVASSERLAAMSQQDTARLTKWFNFFWKMVELHHVEEDDYFFKEILKKVPSIKPKMDKLSEDHQTLHELVNRIGKELIHLQTLEQGDARDQLSGNLREVLIRFRDLLVTHLQNEEAAVVPAINLNFTGQQQKASSDRTLKSMPMKHMSMLVPWIATALTPAEVEQGLKLLPLPARILYRLSWKKKYEKFSAVIRV